MHFSRDGRRQHEAERLRDAGGAGLHRRGLHVHGQPLQRRQQHSALVRPTARPYDHTPRGDGLIFLVQTPILYSC